MTIGRKIIGKGLISVGLVLIVTLLISAVERYERASDSVSAADQLSELERRIDVLEKVGPFEVVDSRGSPIFRVESRPDMGPFYTNKASVYNSQGEPVAIMGA